MADASPKCVDNPPRSTGKYTERRKALLLPAHSLIRSRGGFFFTRLSRLCANERTWLTQAENYPRERERRARPRDVQFARRIRKGLHMDDFEEALRVAWELLRDGDESGGEYRRGIVEFLANLYGVQGVPSDERIDSIEHWLDSFEHVETVAREENPWTVIAVGWRGPSTGVVAFEHTLREDFGTAEFRIGPKAVVFERGHYGLSAETAMDDYRNRLQ